MTWSRLSKIAASLACLLIGAVHAQAASFSITPAADFDTRRFPIEDVEGFVSKRPIVHLSGDIEPGDAEKLEALLRAQPGNNEFLQPVVLSMNSEGGDFRAGIQLGRFIHESHAITTLVERDAVCLSACAVAFMMGYQYHEEAGPLLARYVEAGGRLGFHRPFMGKVLDFDPTVFEGLPQAEIDAFMTAEYALFYDLANQLIQEMLAVDFRAWKNELLVPMLLATADAEGKPSFVYLEKVGQAIEWEIQVIGVDPPTKTGRRDHLEEVWWTCFNTAWPHLFNITWQEADQFGPFDYGLQWLQGERSDNYAHSYDITIFELTGDGCIVSYDRDGNHISAEGHGTGFTTARLREGIGLINLHKPTTRLKDIRTRETAQTPTAQQLLARMDRRFGVCRLSNEGGEVYASACDHTLYVDPQSGARIRRFSPVDAMTLTLIDGANGLTLNGAKVRQWPQNSGIGGHDICLDQIQGSTRFCYGLE